MTWQIEFTSTAAKQFSKLDKPVKERIISFLENRLATIDNPKQSRYSPMKQTINIHEAKTRLSQLLQQVRRG
jgi:mRNA-degrading endonuclease RelE of RelBE toxin-antitoxin system